MAGNVTEPFMTVACVFDQTLSGHGTEFFRGGENKVCGHTASSLFMDGPMDFFAALWNS